MRWPEGFRCPACGHSRASEMTTRRLPLYECRHCRRQTSLTAGTVLEKSRTPLRKWLYAMWLMSQPELSINAVRLQALLSVTYMLRKLRFVLGSLEAQPLLNGNVQAGLDYLGRRILSTLESFEGRKKPVIAAVSIDPSGHLKQIALAAVPPDCVKERILLPAGSVLFAERHVASNARSLYISGSLLLTNRCCIHLRIYVTSVRDWIRNTFHGLGDGYLQTYLDEFVFRVNASMQGVPPFEKLSRLSMSGCRARFSSLALHRVLSRGLESPLLRMIFYCR